MLTDDPNSMPPFVSWKDVGAYAGTRITRSLFAEPENAEECRELLEFALRRHLTICPRGSGYSYADMILNDRHILLDCRRMNGVLQWNKETGRITVEPGVKFSDLFQIALPHKWALAACPGGMAVTIGGAVSNNVHGKDSWKVGNFGEQVVGFKLLTAQGDTLSIDRKSNERLFKTVIGGMGLIGLLTEITLQLTRIPSPFVRIRNIRTKNIDETLKCLDEGRKCSDFSVAWIDAFAKGHQLGRGFVTLASWADENQGYSELRLKKSLTIGKRIFGVLPAKPFWAAASPLFLPRMIREVNRVHYLISSLRSKGEKTLLFSEFNFMHNRIPHINYVYRPDGFLEFEPIIPRSKGARGLAQLLELCQKHGSESLLCGLKAHKQDDFTLSFSGDGYSLGVDIQLRGRDRKDVQRFSKAIYQYTADSGGKIYLAKDEMLTREFFKSMYPNYDKFLSVKAELDPRGLFSSDLNRRLFDGK